MIRHVKVAAVQLESENDGGSAMRAATPYVEKAAAAGAQIILLPELFAAGYVFSQDIWQFAEPRDGPTVRWMCEISERLGTYVGGSFLEAESEDFFNTFVLADPSGAVAGCVRKEVPAAFEACYTRGETSRHIIETPLGRIGVGICYDTELGFFPLRMFEESVDLVLMPHSSPVVMPNVLFPRKYAERYEAEVNRRPEQYARLLGVPAVRADKSGPWRSPVPVFFFLEQHSRFPGRSSIADSNGDVKAELGPTEPGVIVAEVTLDPARKVEDPPKVAGRWVTFQPWPLELFRIIEGLGALSYRLSGRRRRQARQVVRGRAVR